MDRQQIVMLGQCENSKAPDNAMKAHSKYDQAWYDFWQWLWIATTLYTAIGGLITLILSSLGYIGPHCQMPDASGDTYPVCEPCSLRWSVFWVVEVANCDSAITSILFHIGVVVPWLAIAILSIFLYWVPSVLTAVASILFLAFELYHYSRKERNLKRLVHRTSMACILFLSSLNM